MIFIVARGGQAYARLRYGFGPGGQFVLPVEIDFQAAFPAADPAAWEQEYERHVSEQPEQPLKTALATLPADRLPWANDVRPRAMDDHAEGRLWDLYSDFLWEPRNAQF